MKLVDADALKESLAFAFRAFDCSELPEDKKKASLKSIEMCSNILDAQPDASQPLREELARKDARIKELEEVVESCYGYMSTYDPHPKYEGSLDEMRAEICEMSRTVLVKGGQDA